MHNAQVLCRHLRTGAAPNWCIVRAPPEHKKRESPSCHWCTRLRSLHPVRTSVRQSQRRQPRRFPAQQPGVVRAQGDQPSRVQELGAALGTGRRIVTGEHGSGHCRCATASARLRPERQLLRHLVCLKVGVPCHHRAKCPFRPFLLLRRRCRWLGLRLRLRPRLRR